ncbi:hypothetical protein Ccrd_013583 [Cynara cardunculus var. scolymus]|uniref:Uncharacterized protein n=1 Tax=Cynara cardunculus var. scolymus TaxID=59895 RepID=A0A118K4U1_CYNCS|nr:hypothetical protein Ccrd_013583 [Cynara cardunculus var. scolymus]
MGQNITKIRVFCFILEKKPRKRKALNENTEVTMKPNFIVDDINDEYGDEELTIKAIKEFEFDDEDNGFETVCAICDDGGDLSCFEGKCLRAFHAPIKSVESKYESLGLRAEIMQISQHSVSDCHDAESDRHDAESDLYLL